MKGKPVTGVKNTNSTGNKNAKFNRQGPIGPKPMQTHRMPKRGKPKDGHRM